MFVLSEIILHSISIDHERTSCPNKPPQPRVSAQAPTRGKKRSEAVAVIKLNLESERRADKATIRITGEAKCFDALALRNAQDAAGNRREQYKGHLLHVCRPYA